MEAVLAQPRGFCAGVVRAIEIVESALEIHGAPVYVVHEIVHNRHVVALLARRGARFVEDVRAVPEEAVAIFSAHGVTPGVMEEARRRRLQVIDATCPLVTKVHLEVARHARAGREVVLIGHAGHPEVTGTLGHYDASGGGGGIYLVESADDAAGLRVSRPENLAYVTQTTLSVDDAARIVAVLRRRFPAITGPRQDDICYASQNRQAAVRALAAQVDILLVVGARNSSNSSRLQELGEQLGVPSHLVPEPDELDPRWFHSGQRIGITAGASAPEALVEQTVERLRGLGLQAVHEMAGEPEQVTFRLPAHLLRAREARRKV